VLVRILVTTFLIIFCAEGWAHGPEHNHARHNMVLYGQEEVFASHLVYKVPHNFQVILKVNFDEKTQVTYRRERALYPQQKIIYLLDTMNIKDIASAEFISGQVFRIDENGKRIELASEVSLSRGGFAVVYFSELPLSLAN